VEGEGGGGIKPLEAEVCRISMREVERTDGWPGGGVEEEEVIRVGEKNVEMRRDEESAELRRRLLEIMGVRGSLRLSGAEVPVAAEGEGRISWERDGNVGEVVEAEAGRES
jgi:hypothetical protein